MKYKNKNLKIALCISFLSTLFLFTGCSQKNVDADYMKFYKDTKNPEAAWKWVEFLSGEEANKLSAEMGAAIPAYEGTADIWVDKNKAYNLSTFVTASKEYSYPYPVSKNTAEWEQYQAEELKKAYNFQVDVKDACDTLAEKMNEVLASE